MRWVIFLVLVLAGCIVRSPEPVAQEKSLGKVLDDLFKGVADVATEVKKVDSLVKKSAKTALKESEVEQLAGAVVRGGSESITTFKMSAMVGEKLEKMSAILKGFGDRMVAELEKLSSQQMREFEQIIKTDGLTATSGFFKQNTKLADDKIIKRQIELQGEYFDEIAEDIADNHRLAGAVGRELADDVSLKRINIKPEEIANELKIGGKDMAFTGLYDFTKASKVDTGLKYLQELTGADIWREFTHFELMLRRGNDGKPIYTKLKKSEVERIGNPFDKNFTPPVVRANYSNLTDSYIGRIYRGPTKHSDDDFLREFMAKYSPAVPN